ncbi:hypothetical protein NEOKW01_1075 [Nematocida sp. AWRm80]|nr:hypothetical protein NEOKW01_1075 [Nematocida sp. AWRm80]
MQEQNKVLEDNTEKKEKENTNENKETDDEGLIVPKTPEKKNPFKYVDNIETPFKLKIKRTEIREKEPSDTSALFFQPEEPEEIKEEGEWFRKKRAGRKKKPFSLLDTKALVVLKTNRPVCHIEGFFESHYKIISVLYESNESVVYIVEEKELIEVLSAGLICSVCLKNSNTPADLPEKEKRTVVKVTKKKWITSKERQEILKEAKFMHRLRKQKNIIQVLRAWEENAMLFIEMSLCNEGTLKDYLKKGSVLSIQQKIDLVVQLVKGISRIHKAKIIHLDIKPENIYLHKDTKGIIHLKIGDFGISRAAEATTEIEFDGDRLYMAPELLQNQCTYASDIYSVGLVILDVFLETSIAQKEMMPWNRLSQKTKKDLAIKAKISPKLYALLRQMTNTDPSKRPTAQEIHKRIKILIKDKKILKDIQQTPTPIIDTPQTTQTTQTTQTSQATQTDQEN